MFSGQKPKKNVELAQLLQQIQDLVKFSLECENKTLSPKMPYIEVYKQLLQIRMNIAAYQENYKQQLSRLGLTVDDVKPTPEEIAQLKPKDKKILETIQALSKTCQEAKDRVYQSLQENKATLNTVTDDLKDTEMKSIRRRSKFKGVGGKKGWIPT
ncbi:MAG: hypothetical protein JSR46_02350 [Verrucomicrobia bacterium]|nr:hypothetical protein [Verrucomicrobiota bacterium]